MGQDFVGHGVRHQTRERTLGGTGKASVDVLAVWNFATEEEKSVDVDDGDGDHGSAGQVVEESKGHHAAHGFDSVDFVAMQAAAQEDSRAGVFAAKHVHGHVNQGSRQESGDLQIDSFN